jgi:hypothetical protein
MEGVNGTEGSGVEGETIVQTRKNVWKLKK